ncbi:MAG: PEF-CTERM sorting domain-containing protein [Halobacteriota archaeon]|nr:PEF-CTERM sorting domain-containing protein [Halobacteriota archaeon]
MKIGRRDIIAILVIFSIFGGLVVALPSQNQVDNQPVNTILTSETTGQYPDIDVGDDEDDDGSGTTETDANATSSESDKKTRYVGGTGGYSSVGVFSVSNPTPTPDPEDPSPTPDPADPTPDPEDPSPSPDPENPEEIPEFPTVAIPAAMILGLVFLMQRRK